MKKPSLEKTRRVGIWMDIDWALKREMEVYAGCHRYAAEAGIELVLDPGLVGNRKPLPADIPYDGILTRVTRPLANAAKRAGIPIVNVWCNSPVRNVPAVVPDYEQSGVLAAEHLLGRGFRNFGFMGIKPMRSVAMQYDGFRKTVERAGFECSGFWFGVEVLDPLDKIWKSFAHDLQDWLSKLRPPIGMLACDDVICRFLMNACIQAKLNVPGDLAVIGTSNEELICKFPSPSLSSLELGHEERGYRAAKLLDELMGGARAPDEPLRLPLPRLVARHSSDVFATGDPVVALAMRFIADNSHRTLRVGEVAAVAGVSQRTLLTRFRESVGRSINEEVIRLRLNRAKRRLADDTVGLKLVAYESGFRTASYFTKVFTRVIGVSPSEYRKQLAGRK